MPLESAVHGNPSPLESGVLGTLRSFISQLNSAAEIPGQSSTFIPISEIFPQVIQNYAKSLHIFFKWRFAPSIEQLLPIRIDDWGERALERADSL